VLSHEKIFNEAMCTQDDVYFLHFHKCFIREIRKTYTVDCVFPKLSHGIIGVFLSIHDQVPSFFPHDF
jgi:hypothetical protein